MLKTAEVRMNSDETFLSWTPTNKQKQHNAQGSTKSLNISKSVESMDIETDNIIQNLNLADISKYIRK